MKCQTTYCRKKAHRHSNGYLTNYCLPCTTRRYKAKHPFQYHYNAFRGNARRRGKDFTITLEEYKQFALAQGLFSPTGVKYPNRSIDRIDQSRGYHLDNIQVLTLSENSRKRFVDYYQAKFETLDAEEQAKWKEYEQRLQSEIDERRQHENEFDDIPF